MLNLEKSWKDVLKIEFEKTYFKNLVSFLNSEKMKHEIYPEDSMVFSAFNHTPFEKVKVVIIGQDPYHGKGQANGLSFSVPDGVKIPPSLLNIFKELKTDLGFEIPLSGNLEHWAEQGVLLLNTTLTVRANEPGSHQKKGWEIFTDKVIELISEKRKNVVFLLWGKFAHEKEKLIREDKHLILKAAHPSPLARGAFFGCRHFSKTNEFLAAKNTSPIDWDLPFFRRN